MESMGKPEQYGVMRGTQFQSLRPKQEAVCSENACWETLTERFPSGHRFYLKDDPRKKSESPMKSVATFLFRSFLKRDSSASDSEKEKKSST